MNMMNVNVMNWKSTEFRRRMVQQLNEIINAHPQYSANAGPVQLENAAFNRSNTQFVDTGLAINITNGYGLSNEVHRDEDYIRNIRSVMLMIKQQQQRHAQQQQQHAAGPPSITHQFREHQIQSMRQQIMDQQHSMNTPSYPMMAQQQQPQQQPQTQIDAAGRSFMTQDHPTQQQMYDSVRSNMPSASFSNVSHSTPYMRPGPPANVTITAVSTSLPSSLSTSGLSFSVAPQPTAVDGSTVTAHYGASGQQRSPYNVQNYPTSTATVASLPATTQGHMEPSLSLFNQPSPGSPATSAEEEQQYIQKRHELSQYIPTVMKVINKYTSRGTPEDAQRLQQVAKLRDFVKMLQDNTRKIPLSALAKWEVALKKIFPSTNVESNIASDPMMSGSGPSLMHPPSSQPLSVIPQVSSTHTISSRAPQLELQSTNSPTLSYSTPTTRENQLALQLMCKQHEKKDMSSGVKSLPLLRRELEHLEDYFVCKEEIDSNENCIVLTCSLKDDYVPTDIPSLIVRIPDNYPTVPPEYIMNGYQNSSLLLNIEKHVGKQLISMNLYSVTQLLHVWESSVRNGVKDIVALA